MCKITIATFSEDIRDRYIVIDKNNEEGITVSNVKNLCKRIKSEFSLKLNYTEAELNNYYKFKELVDELDKNGYCVFQLTRL